MKNRFFLVFLALNLFCLFLVSGASVKAQAVPCQSLKTTTLPAPGDYGSAGQFTVTRSAIAHPNPAVPDAVSVFLPGNASAQNRVPVIFFAHGFGGFQYQYYEDLLRQLTSNGYAVVFAPYTANIFAGNVARYDQLWTGFQLAVEQSGGVMDTSRIGFAGHSYGAGALPEMTRRAVAAGWGKNGLFMFSMAPWYSWGSNYEQIPASAKLVVQVYWDDGTNEHLIGQNDVWNRLPQIIERKWEVIRTAQTSCSLNAGHGVPVTGNATDAAGGGIVNAHDVWGVWRRIHALADYTFTNNARAKDVAFGVDARMGRWRRFSLRPVTPLEATDAPVVNPQQTAKFRWADKCLYAQGSPCVQN